MAPGFALLPETSSLRWQIYCICRLTALTYGADLKSERNVLLHKHRCLACSDEAHSSAADMAPVRSGCVPVAVQFTKLETEHLPARETRELEISSYKRKSQVLLEMSCSL